MEMNDSCYNNLFSNGFLYYAVHWFIAIKWKMSVVKSLLMLFKINNCVMQKWLPKWELAHLISWWAYDTAVSRSQQDFWVKVCTWRIKLQPYYWRCTRTHLNTESESGEILVMLGTVCVTPWRSFLSATECFSYLGKHICYIWLS